MIDQKKVYSSAFLCLKLFTISEFIFCLHAYFCKYFQISSFCFSFLRYRAIYELWVKLSCHLLLSSVAGCPPAFIYQRFYSDTMRMESSKGQRRGGNFYADLRYSLTKSFCFRRTGLVVFSIMLDKVDRYNIFTWSDQIKLKFNSLLFYPLVPDDIEPSDSISDKTE